MATNLQIEPIPRKVPLERNLRALLVQTTASDHLQRVTVLQLRVIADEVPLQHLGAHMPALRELRLDGGVVRTLRALGALRSLRVLSVNRCRLRSVAGATGLARLEELHARGNAIETVVPCAFYASLRVLDVRENRIGDALAAVGFLGMCERLEVLWLGAPAAAGLRGRVRELMPGLRCFDGFCYEDGSEIGDQSMAFAVGRRSTRQKQEELDSSGNKAFQINFPPTVFMN